MKRFFRICTLLLALALADVAQAQTKDFLQWYQTIKHRFERYSAEEMEGAAALKVKLLAEVHTGANWDEAK